jgi:hypothetical protein
MEVSARFCRSSRVTPACAATQEALALLQHEMERRFVETLFGAENLSAEAENFVLSRNSVVAEAKITALWELRTLFGPRGSPPKPLEDLPAEVRAGLSSMFGAGSDGSSGHGRRGSLASLRTKAVCAPFDNPSRSWNMTAHGPSVTPEGEKGTR